MIFTETKLTGAYVIDLDKLRDDRGFFARSFCAREFESHGLIPSVVQSNVSFSSKKGTLRGMHYQVEPHGETKLIRCTKGAIYDVIIDLRRGSATYRKWFGVELTQDNYRTVYVPRDFAHGFLTLTDDAEVMYHVSEFYTPNSEKGIRYNDSAFGIQWPLDICVISPKDAAWPDF